MSIETALFSHLSANVPLADGRVYPLVAPMSVSFPAVVYTTVSDVDHGYMLCDDGNATRMQIDCYDETFSGSIAIKDEVKAALYSFEHYPHDLNTQSLYEKETGLFRQMIELTFKG